MFNRYSFNVSIKGIFSPPRRKNLQKDVYMSTTLFTTLVFYTIYRLVHPCLKKVPRFYYIVSNYNGSCSICKYCIDAIILPVSILKYTDKRWGSFE